MIYCNIMKIIILYNMYISYFIICITYLVYSKLHCIILYHITIYIILCLYDTIMYHTILHYDIISLDDIVL